MSRKVAMTSNEPKGCREEKESKPKFELTEISAIYVKRRKLSRNRSSFPRRNHSSSTGRYSSSVWNQRRTLSGYCGDDGIDNRLTGSDRYSPNDSDRSRRRSASGTFCWSGTRNRIFDATFLGGNDIKLSH
ncbi:hypothetical protein RRG08_067302 [Elysia crispata]|uniref:Uncharacterized protein n=1 Tax=Elysia crispata TaxID=231223 RepID=A0AAE0ZAF8_9GAST|nr:hypothetical protein RRG08_067302 [Elysia crispata]